MKHLVVVASLLAVCGCTPSEHAVPDSKLDAPLRQKLAELKGLGTSSDLAVFVRCTEVPGDVQRRELREAGLRIESEVGEVLAGRADSQRMLALASLEFVRSVQLSQTSAPLPLK